MKGPLGPGLSLLLLLAAATPAASAVGDPAHAAPGPDAPPAGHTRMLDRLVEVRQESLGENPYLGVSQIAELEARIAALPQPHTDPTAWQLSMRLATHLLRVGREEDAVARFEDAQHEIDQFFQLGDPDDPSLRRAAIETMYDTGVAWMRVGESRNCVARHTSDSCLFPIRGGGVHVDKEAAEKAAALFTRVLEQTTPNSYHNVKARWLLNIAAMTLGRWPDGVPEAWRIPASAFASDEPFPRFPEIAPSLGLNTFDLSGGAVVDDFDGDGHLDLVVSTLDTAGQMRLFHNNGNGTFVERTGEAGLTGLTGGLNMNQADYDNDGDVDLLVLRGAWFRQWGRHPNSLLRNDGKGHFTDAGYDSGIAGTDWPTQAASWADYDLDGDLDLYVGNETDPQFEAPCQLFRNNGDGTFTDVAEAAGVTGPIASFPSWFWDFDNDGILDLLVASYGTPNRPDVADLAASYLGLPHRADRVFLYHGTASGHFEEIGSRAGLSRPYLVMGANYGDLDNDGFPDAYLGTGYPLYEALTPNVMLHNRGGHDFADVTTAGGFGHLQKGHAIVFADLDEDGDQDVFEQMGGAYPGDAFGNALYRNPGFGNHWIKIRLVGVSANRAGVGARIRADIVEGETRRSVHRLVGSGGSFGANPLRQEIGLGAATSIERLEVLWPGSKEPQVFSEVPVDRAIEIRQDSPDYRTLPLKPVRLDG